MVNRRPLVNDATIQWNLPAAAKAVMREAARLEGIPLSVWLLDRVLPVARAEVEGVEGKVDEQGA